MCELVYGKYFGYWVKLIYMGGKWRWSFAFGPGLFSNIGPFIFDVFKSRG